MLTLQKHKSPETRTVWDTFATPDMDKIQDASYESVLERIIQDADPAELNPKFANMLRIMKECMLAFWDTDQYKYSPTPKKDFTHSRRILHYIDLLLFHPSTRDEITCIYTHLTYHDAFLLVCAVYLHDYAKGQFKLIIPELAPDEREHFANATHVVNLHPEMYDKLELYHSLVIYTFLEHFHTSKSLRELQDSLLNRYTDIAIRQHIRNLSKQLRIDETTALDKIIIGNNASVAQDWLFNLFWQLKNESLGHSASPLRAIQLICACHKTFPHAGGIQFNHSHDLFDCIDELEQSKDQDRIKLLAALLRIGDNLDFTKERLKETDPLIEPFLTWVQSGRQQRIPDTYRRRFEKWLKFLIVDRVQVTHAVKYDDGNGRRKEMMTIEVIIRYKRFSKWEKGMLAIRRVVERDFAATNYLKALNYDGDERDIDLSLQFVIDPIAIATDQVIRENWDRISEELRESPGWQQAQPPDVFKMVKEIPSLEFSVLSKDPHLPNCFELLYLLGFLETYGTRPCEDLGKSLGMKGIKHLDTKRAGEVIHIDVEKRCVQVSKKLEPDIRRFLRSFREHPALIRQKVLELECLGEVLPFSRREANTIPTGIHGLDLIISPSAGQRNSVRGFGHSRSILVVGGPGTGKTTLLIQILHSNYEREQRSVLLLTFEELEPLIVNTYKDHFGWDVNFVESVSISQIDTLDDIHEKIEERKPELIAIDGLSRFRAKYTDPNKYRDEMDTFFRSLQIKGITGIFSIEEPAGNNPREEYQADGIIHLHQTENGRELVIEKLRGQGFVQGRHPFEILDRVSLEQRRHTDSIDAAESFPYCQGINVYPNDKYYASLHRSQRDDEPRAVQHVSTGIRNLDKLLPGEGNRAGYRKGSSVLVLGSPGAGKTLFGLHFLKEECKRSAGPPADYSKDNPKVIWLSFEGPESLLRKSIGTFDLAVGYKELLDSPDFLFSYIPPALISPSELLFYIARWIEKGSIRRIVIDSVTEIESVFGNARGDFRQYMRTLVPLMSSHNVTSMLLSRVPGFFRSYQEYQSEISSIVDTIISIKTFDMKNEIRRGLFVLKNRGQRLDSKLQTMHISSQRGIEVSFRGWEYEGLLSGEVQEIIKPEVFLKLFYENPAERQINGEIIREFKRRYPGTGKFTQVKKDTISSEFWSFRGHFGAGHANIRVVSISMYMVQAFRELDRLHELDEFFPEKLKRQIQQDFRWKRYRTESRKHDNIPKYIDMGFLVKRTDLAARLGDSMSDEERERLPHGCRLFGVSSDTGIECEPTVSWEELRQVCRDLDIGDRRPYVFSMPYLLSQAEFISFFCEILWSMGGDIYHFPIVSDEDSGATRMDSYTRQILRNKAVWRDFVRVVRERLEKCPESSALPEQKESGERILNELAERIVPLAEAIFGPEWTDEIKSKQDLENVLSAFEKEAERTLDIDDEDVITINNSLGVRALEFIYDLVFDSNGKIPNPYEGDFSAESVYCRKWYSQIRDLKDKVGSQNVVVLPVPYFEVADPAGNGVRRRSCCAETVWCLALMREALSPEIGWIFIDTLTSTEWVGKRAEYQRGFPHRFEDMRSMAHHDKDVYKLLKVVMDNKEIKERVYTAKTRLADRALTNVEFGHWMTQFFGGEYHSRDVGDVLKLLRGDRTLTRRAQIFENECKSQKVPLNHQARISELPDFEAKLSLRSKVTSNRPFFYRVESILHEEIQDLFSPVGRRRWYEELTGRPVVGVSDEHVSGELRRLRREERTERARDSRYSGGLICRTLQRVHDRIVFDVLTAVPEQVRRMWPRQ